MEEKKPFALISVSDKTGVVELARALLPFYRILSTGGTGAFLAEHDVPFLEVSEYTGSKELFEGRVKTLHPLIHGGILFTRKQEEEARENNINPIDVVVVNLYPFIDTLRLNRKASHEDLLELIDIGGPTLLRAAAKNYERVIVLSSPTQYEEFVERLTQNALDREYRKNLALEAFQAVTDYDLWIERFLRGGKQVLERPYIAPNKVVPLRYGENQHQQGIYITDYLNPPFLEQLHGKLISFNNLADFNTGLRIVKEFPEEPTVAIIKHTSPCGVASHEDLSVAWDAAFQSDPIGAYGAAMVFNRPITLAVAQKMHEMFVDAVLAPDYEPEAFLLLAKKQKIVICRIINDNLPDYEVLSLPGGVAVQERDSSNLSVEDLKVIAGPEPTPELIQDALYAWKIVKHVKSNAAVVVKNKQTLGIGAGLSSRIAVVKFSLQQAGEKARGAVLATDGFFPYPDSIEAAAQAGIKAIINPTGSIRDEESINAAQKYGLTFIKSPLRSFRH